MSTFYDPKILINISICWSWSSVCPRCSAPSPSSTPSRPTCLTTEIYLHDSHPANCFSTYSKTASHSCSARSASTHPPASCASVAWLPDWVLVTKASEITVACFPCTHVRNDWSYWLSAVASPRSKLPSTEPTFLFLFRIEAPWAETPIALFLPWSFQNLIWAAGSISSPPSTFLCSHGFGATSRSAWSTCTPVLPPCLLISPPACLCTEVVRGFAVSRLVVCVTSVSDFPLLDLCMYMRLFFKTSGLLAHRSAEVCFDSNASWSQKWVSHCCFLNTFWRRKVCLTVEDCVFNSIGFFLLSSFRRSFGLLLTLCLVNSLLCFHTFVWVSQCY